MPNVSLTKALRIEYENLFNSCNIRTTKKGVVDQLLRSINSNKTRYGRVANRLNIPWYVIAVIHNMESSQSFNAHLHNGDPLSGRTRQVPADRPKTGTPPFTWEESAEDALKLKRLHLKQDWSIPATLYVLESYNGWGYRLYHPHVLSPYLWSFTNHYTSGKYVADGRWSDTAVSRQCGAAALLRRMAENGEIQFPDQPAPSAGSSLSVVPYAVRKPRDPVILERAKQLQSWLNTHQGIFLSVDGHAGKRTSSAFKLVAGSYLPGDPRG